MYQTWKCDFCSHTDIDPKNVKDHENKCSFNPNTKSCYTCQFCFEDGAPISGFYNSCKKGLECWEAEEGNCSEWIISDNLKTKRIKSKIKEF